MDEKTVMLIVDDVEINRAVLSQFFQDEYTVVEAVNGQEALKIIESQSVGIVLVDLVMPVMDGYTVCKEIRKVNERIPILFLSAKDEEIDRVVGLELGADDYLGKPFGIHEIRARIKTIARRCYLYDHSDEPKQPAEGFAFGGWWIDSQKLMASKNNECISLTMREITILEYFHQHPNEVVTRDTLFNIAWGYEHLPNSRTLDQHISKLRKLIEDNPQSPVLIQTVHGLGYRYIQP